MGLEKHFTVNTTMEFDQAMSEFNHKLREYFHTWFNYHISHNDLDGYGCNVIESIVRSCYDSNILDGIIHINTPTIGDRFKDNLIQILTAYIIESKCFNSKDEIYVLITDIGLTFDALKEAADVVVPDGKLIKFIVIDHHQTMYANDNSGDVASNLSGDTFIITKSSEKCSMNAYISYNASATLLFYHIVKDLGFIPMKCPIEELEQFSEAVSRYDTGNWGDWDITADCRADSVKKYNDDVDLSFKFNVFHRLCLDKAKDVAPWYDPAAIRMMDDIWTQINIKLIMQPEYTLEPNIANAIYTKVCDMNTEYLEFEKDITSCQSKYQLEEFLINNKVTPECANKIAEVIENLMVKCPGAIYQPFLYENKIHIIASDGATFPFFIFAKRLLKRGSDDRIRNYGYDNSQEIAMMVNMKVKTMSVATLDHGPNVYEICKQMNGGGHPHAGGFPLEFVEVPEEGETDASV